MIRDMASGDTGYEWTTPGALLRSAHLAVLLAAAGLIATLTGCVSPAVHGEDAIAEPEAEVTTPADQITALRAEVAALEAEVAAAQAATGEARTMAEQAREQAGEAEAAADAAQEQAAAVEAESMAAKAAAQSARDKADMMAADAHRASRVTISAGEIDPNLLNLNDARVWLAGPESIYISSIGYADSTYSTLLRYRGGTTATVEGIFGNAGKLIPDSVDLLHTELSLVGPDTVEVAFVGVGGTGYSGQLRYAGDNRLEVVGIRKVTLPPTAKELVAAAEARADAAIAEARAAAEAAVEAAEARLAAVEAESAAEVAEAEATLEAARDKVDMMMAEAHRPSEVMIPAGRIDPGLLNLDGARVSVAGPESIYITGIEYGDDTYSALMRYRGGTTATLDKVFGSSGKLIPDSVDLSHTALSLIAPDLLDVANVGVGGRGYSGQLRYAGDNRFEVVGLTPVMLPPTAEELVAQAEARAAAAVAGARDAAAAAAAAAQASAADAEAARAAVAEAEQLLADVEAESAAAIAEARDALAGARDKVDMLMAEAYRPSVVMISADQIEPGLLNLDAAEVSLAGPESVYISSIRYAGATYSALLRYRGGTTATVESIFGPTGKLIPDSVDLSRTELTLVEPDILDVANVGVGGSGYSGQLRYAGNNRLEVVGIRPVTLPPTADELVAAARADAAAGVAEARAAADAAIAAAQADTAAAQADAAAARADAAAARAAIEALNLKLAPMGGVMIPGDLDMRRLDLGSATVSVAGPDSIYIAGIGYGMKDYAVRLRHESGNTGVAERVYDTADGIMPAVDLSAPAIAAVARDTLVVSNVGIGGEAYAVSFQARPDGSIVITPRGLGHRVRTAAELMRDELVAAPAAGRVVDGFDTGAAQPDEGEWMIAGAGAWTAGGGRVSQTDPAATHAKFSLSNVAQANGATLYGVTGYADAGARTGFGLHFLASETPASANTWNYGNSYLVWITQEVGFYDTDHAHVQLYQSLDGNRLMWLNSTKIARSLDSEVTIEALYQPGDCPPMGAGACAGSIAVFVDGNEQFKVVATGAVSAQAADTVALRALGGPVHFLELYAVSAD